MIGANAHLMDDGNGQESPTCRTFLLGAGFSKLAGLPLASELLPAVENVAKQFLRHNGRCHLESALDEYREFLSATEPGERVDIETFGA